MRRGGRRAVEWAFGLLGRVHGHRAMREWELSSLILARISYLVPVKQAVRARKHKPKLSIFKSGFLFLGATRFTKMILQVSGNSGPGNLGSGFYACPR
jgi:hypothetical protein